MGDLLFISGQAANDADGKVVGPDFRAQVRQTYSNMAAVLESNGSSLDRVVKMTTYVVGSHRFADFLAVYNETFSAPYPADTYVVVEGLALPELLVEIDAVAAA